MNILLTGGGTGGHVYPSIEVGLELKRRYKANLHYMGNERHIEGTLAKKAFIPFYGIPSKGLEGHTPLERYGKFAYENTLGVKEALKAMIRIKPDFVFATGGFVSGPVLLAASLLRIPYAIHEQNAVMGKVNRLFAKGAANVFHSFPLESKPTNQKNVWSGNPVRYRQKRGIIGDRLVVMGGSGGSRKLNDAALYLALETNYPILLQAGRALYEEVMNKKRKMGIGEQLEVKPYLDDMLEAYDAAKILLTRSGAGAVFETANLGIPTIFVPLPTSTDDHQKKNAAYLTTKKAALLVEEAENFHEKILETVTQLWDDDRTLSSLSSNLERYAIRDSAERIAEELGKQRGWKKECNIQTQ